MNALERFADLHLTRLQKAWGVPARYLRGETEIELTAVAGSTETASDGTDLVPLLDTDRDWILDARKLLDDGVPFTPAKGDRLVVQWQGRRTEYLVTPNEAIDREWYYSEQSETIIRVHTKPRDDEE